MAYVIASGNVPQSAELKTLKTNLIQALNYAHSIDRQIDQMSDAEITSQYGIPTAAVSQFRTMVNALIVSLESASVTAIISQLGFDV